MTDETKRVAREPTPPRSVIERLEKRLHDLTHNGRGELINLRPDANRELITDALLALRAAEQLADAVRVFSPGPDWGAGMWRALAAYDGAAPAAAPSDRERRLHEALRLRVICRELDACPPPRDWFIYCGLCDEEGWRDGEPERHRPGCLAAPLPQEGE